MGWNHQLVNCWSRWFGIRIGILLSNNPLSKGILGIPNWLRHLVYFVAIQWTNIPLVFQHVQLLNSCWVHDHCNICTPGKAIFSNGTYLLPAELVLVETVCQNSQKVRTNTKLWGPSIKYTSLKFSHFFTWKNQPKLAEKGDGFRSWKASFQWTLLQLWARYSYLVLTWIFFWLTHHLRLVVKFVPLFTVF